MIYNEIKNSCFDSQEKFSKKKSHVRTDLTKRFIFFFIIFNLNIYISSVIIENILSISKSSYILLKIFGAGEHSIISDEFTNLPDEIYINNVKKDNINTTYNLVEENNTIKLFWENQVKDCSKMFKKCYDISEIDFSNFDTSNIINMDALFYRCYSLKYLNLSNWKVDEVTSIRYLFNGCYSLSSIELPNFKNAKILLMNGMFYNCSSLTSINLSTINTSLVNNTGNLFYRCSLLTSIDISHFDTSNVITMDNMFNGCKSLTEINVTNFNTKNAEKMDFMFSGCESITSIELSNFDTSKVNKMHNMFSGCKSLISINLSNFNMNSVNNISNMFSNCSSLEYINLKNSNPDISISENTIFSETAKNLVICTESQILMGNIPTSSCGIVNCSVNWREAQKKINTQNNLCVDNCLLVNYKYDFLSKCYNECPIGTYANEYYKCEKCHSDCKTCEGPASPNSTNCKSCLGDEKYLKFRNCVSVCKNGFYTDENDLSIKICKCDLDKCDKCSEESFNKNLCISCNDNYYPKYNDEKNIKTFVNCYNYTEEGFYLDMQNSIYKSCYESCKSCDTEGQETQHNCKECKDSYNFILNIIGNSYINCYKGCEHYFFSNGSNYNICTSNENCPEKYNKFIKEKKQCIDDCSKDNSYKYEYNNICYNKCPNWTELDDLNRTCINKTLDEIIETTIKINIKSSINDYEYSDVNTIISNTKISSNIETQYISNTNLNSKVLNNLPSSTIISIKSDSKENSSQITDIKDSFITISNTNKYSILLSDTKDSSLLLNNTNEYQILISDTKESSIQIVPIDYLEQVYEIDDIIYQITTTEKQFKALENYSLNERNLSIIDLNECEDILKEEYNISKNDPLIIFKQEKKTNKASEKNISFEILEPYNKTKLNLSLCEALK